MNQERNLQNDRLFGFRVRRSYIDPPSGPGLDEDMAEVRITQIQAESGEWREPTSHVSGTYRYSVTDIPLLIARLTVAVGEARLMSAGKWEPS